MWETWVQSLGREDLLEKEMATHSSILAWKIPWMEEPGRLYIVHGVAKSRTRLSVFTHFGIAPHCSLPLPSLTRLTVFPWSHPGVSLAHLGHMSFSEAGERGCFVWPDMGHVSSLLPGVTVSPNSAISPGGGEEWLPKERTGSLLPEKSGMSVGQLKPLYKTQLRTQIPTGV